MQPTSVKTQPITDLVKERKDCGEESFRLDHAHPFLFLMPCPEDEPHETEVDTLAGEGGYRLEDLGSTNAMKLYGNPLEKHKPVKLKNGDVVSFWRYTFEYMELDLVLSLLTPRKRKS